MYSQLLFGPHCSTICCASLLLKLLSRVVENLKMLHTIKAKVNKQILMIFFSYFRYATTYMASVRPVGDEAIGQDNARTDQLQNGKPSSKIIPNWVN